MEKEEEMLLYLRRSKVEKKQLQQEDKK